MSDETGARVSRIYGGFRGVDFRGEEVHLSRSPDSLNMWKDYSGTESIKSRPGTWLVSAGLIEAGSRVYGMYVHRPSRAYNEEKFLYVCYQGKTDTTIKIKCMKLGTMGSLESDQTICSALLSSGKTKFFTFGDKVYIMNPSRYLCHTPGAASAEDVDPYVPTTTIGRSPAGGGTIHQDVNKLTNNRKNTFLADGKSTKYYTDGKINTLVSVKVNGAYYAIGTDCAAFGDYVTFYKIPPAPNTDGQDNVEIEFAASMSSTASEVLDCEALTVFDNRVFVGGAPSKPNYLWHSSLNDPTYFSDLDYYQDGLDNAKIKGLVAGNNALWVFREPSSHNATIFYHTPTIDPDYGTIYPSVHSSISTGCIGGAVNFNDDIVFFSERGMEGISGDVTTEQVIAHRSTLVDRKLVKESAYKDMSIAEWEGYLIVALGNRIYLADSRARFTNTDHMEYEWFCWEYGFNILGVYAIDGYLFLLGDNGNIYAHNMKWFGTIGTDGANKTPVKYTSYWVTPKDRFGAPQKLKTTNKRGCVVEATGNITVSVKTENTEFEEVGTYENVTDYFCCRIKRKKWKDIQLKFEADSKFSLETATLEAFIGGYIKR